MTRVINSEEDMLKYVELLKTVKQPIPEDLLVNVKKAVSSTTYGLKLRFLVRISDDLPEYLEYFLEE